MRSSIGYAMDATRSCGSANCWLKKTGTRLPDWIDHYALPASEATESRLEQTGFVPQHQAQSVVWELSVRPVSSNRSPRGSDVAAGDPRRVGLRFFDGTGLRQGHQMIEGETAPAAAQKPRPGGQSGVELWVVERHGYRGWETPEFTSAQVEAVRAPR